MLAEFMMASYNTSFSQSGALDDQERPALIFPEVDPVQPWAERFYNSKAWHRCRAGFISNRINIDGGRCEVCGISQGYIVHHRIHLTPTNINDPSISLDWSNLQYVCKACHDQFDGHGLAHKKSTAVVLFDDSGCPIGRTSPPV